MPLLVIFTEFVVTDVNVKPEAGSAPLTSPPNATPAVTSASDVANAATIRNLRIVAPSFSPESRTVGWAGLAIGPTRRAGDRIGPPCRWAPRTRSSLPPGSMRRHRTEGKSDPGGPVRVRTGERRCRSERLSACLGQLRCAGLFDHRKYGCAMMAIA